MLQTRIGSVFRNELLLNSKRVAPYVLMILFAVHAVLWWGWGPAVDLGWATNSDYYIHRNLLGFSFLLGLPIFNAVIMGDAVIRDFRLGIDPLIFSKPISRAEYLLGKFLGNFFVLVCCQSVFMLTLFVLQGFRISNMVVQPFQVVPYFKHFFLLVVIPHLLLAAFYFTLGTLTRNAKFVYGAAVAFYPVYFAYLLLLKDVPQTWAVLLDPLLVTATLKGNGFYHSADFLNQLVMSYSPVMLANRALVMMCAAVCLAILYLRFTVSERSAPATNLTTLSLSTASGGVYFDRGTFEVAAKAPEVVLLPEVSRTSKGSLNKLVGALLVEFRLLCVERSLIVLFPLAIMLSTLEITFFRVVVDFSYSATYATNTAGTLLLFIIGIVVFYAGEAMHRDRELRIEPVLWSTPAPNSVFLISKFLLTVVLSFVLIGAVGLTAMVVQVARSHRPVEVTPYLLVYGIVLLPSVIFLSGVSVFLNIALKNKYLAYVVSIGTAAGLFYLYSVGYNHWLYNPLFYRLWHYADLIGQNQSTIFSQRAYCIAIGLACLALAHVLFERKSTRRLI